jgi:ABC-type antimicrobial peptide transport system permease subunit
VALGASIFQAGHAIAGNSYRAAALGLLLGLGLAAGLAQWAEPLLFAVSSSDLASYAIPGCLLLAVLSLVAWRPVREAARIHPAEALRDGGGC